MKNTLENKEKFFMQYWKQDVLMFGLKDKKWRLDKYFFPIRKGDYLELTPLSQISDEDAIHVANLAHQSLSGDWVIIRRDKDTVNGSIHIQKDSNLNNLYHVGISYKYAEIFCNHHFLKTKDDTPKSYRVNIGQISISASRPVPYIAIVDFLRSKGYALPWNGISVEEQIEFGWIKLKQYND